MRTRAAALAVGLGASMLAIGGVAMAAPTNSPRAQEVPVDCGSNGTYTVVVNGNGRWTPAHDTASNTVFVPTAFGPFTGTFTDNDGNTFPINDPPFAKHTEPPNGHPTMTCSYTVTFSDENGTGHGSGTATVFIANQK